MLVVCFSLKNAHPFIGELPPIYGRFQGGLLAKQARVALYPKSNPAVRRFGGGAER